MSGWTYAFAAVVDVRSYSRISGATWEDSVTWNSGNSRSRISPIASSCAGFR